MEGYSMQTKQKYIPITIKLTPEQVKEAYHQIVRIEHKDWFYEPEVLEELLKRDRKTLADFKKGKAIPWEKIRKEID
jgi:hypothetical protein